MNKFELKSIKITKELLLARNPAERYFEHYLGIPVKKGLFVCPPDLRVDHRPTCSFYKNKKGELILNDFAGKSYNFIDIVMTLYDCTYYKALRIIANDFNIDSFKNYEVHQPKIEYTNTIINESPASSIQVQIKDFSKVELDWWKEYGINYNTLKKFKVFSIKHVLLNGYYFITSDTSQPIYGYYGGLDSEGNELWRIYFPNRTEYRFLSNWKNTMIQGSKQLKFGSNDLIITKSLKDVICLHEFGFSAIAPCSENSFLTQAQYSKLKNKFENIYLFYDNDLPGIRATQKIRKEFPDLKIILIPRKYECKDFSDLVKKYKKESVLKMIDEWKNK